ncbi:MAG: lipid-A-disaccharide synthase [Flavobacteriales bacterium]|jgi:lipid-A-disaccharide synthase|nr:lipid-A-disaccharide synthase [Flavobacteriales bacterium]
MKFFIVSGEASGDLHGANLVKEIKKLSPDSTFTGWGGDLMAAQGVTIKKHYKELAFMGFLEVVKNIRTIFKNIKLCKQQIIEEQPDAIIFVDYPGFNLRIAKFAKAKGFKTLYYISPTVWAWKEKRIEKIKRDVDRLFVILPFEQEFYKERGCEVEFVGHPLIDAIEDFRENKALLSNDFYKKYHLNQQQIIALLPGSRKQEITKKLPIMMAVAHHYKDYQFVIAGAPGLEKSFYESVIGEHEIKIIFNDTYNLLNNAHAALVTSGTATLETALFNVPQVVCYQTSSISYHIAKRLVNIQYISLVNLILNREVVKELIQGELNEEQLGIAFEAILKGDFREQQLQAYQKLTALCGGVGASKNAAKGMLKVAKG